MLFRSDQGEVIAVTATIESLSPTEFGGADQITSGAGSDIMIGGRYGDTMTDLGGSNILLGDSVVLVAASRVTSPHTPLRSLAFARISSISDSPEDASDTIWSDGDNDLVIGGTGADSIYTGSGTDIVFGDEVDVWTDSDQLIDITIDAFRATRAARFSLRSDNQYSRSYDDWIDSGNNDDMVFGQQGFDRLFGGAGNDLIYGGMGNDLISGDGGDDLVLGGEGDDELRGGSGNDTIDGGDGRDRIDGGAGND